MKRLPFDDRLPLLLCLAFLSPESAAQTHVSAKPSFLPVGTQDASPTVDLRSGALVYSYSFQLPPGVRDVAPVIGLSYSSQSQSTGFFSVWVGTGWSINIPTISRMGPTGGPPTCEDNDSYILSMIAPEPLFVIAREPTGWIWDTEHASFMRVVSEPLTATNHYSPYEWRVTDRADATYAFRPALSGSGCATAWAVSSITDSFGNVISYRYTVAATPSSHTVASPSEVSWGPYLLRFIYGSLVPAQRYAAFGALISRDKILERVEVRAQNGTISSVLWTYHLQYGTLSGSRRPYLERITRLGADNISELPSTRFSISSQVGIDLIHAKRKPWSNSKDIAFSAETVISDVRARVGHRPTGNLIWAASTQALADFNGDGRLDHVESCGSGSGCFDREWNVRLNNGSGFDSPKSWPGTTNRRFIQEADGAGKAAIVRQMIADFNGDGRVDLISCNSDNTWIVQLNSGNGFGSPQRWGGEGWSGCNTPDPDGFPGTGLAYLDKDGNIIAMPVDMNGDGWLDWVDSRSGVWLNGGSPTAGFRYAGNAWSFAGPVVWNLGDERICDLLDINGDGLPDRVVVDQTTHAWSVYLNSGRGFLAPSVWPAAPVAIERSCSYGRCGGLLDLNGDGLLDQVLPAQLGYTEIRFNTGQGFDGDHPLTVPSQNGFGYDPHVTGERQDGYIAYMNMNSNIRSFLWTDFDGDGAADRIEQGRSGGWTITTDIVPIRPVLIRQLQRPLGGQYDISYGNSAQQRSPYLLTAVAVVSAITERPFGPGKAGSANTRVFAYESGGVYRTSRDVISLGFAKVVETQGTRVVETTYSRNPPGDVGQVISQCVYEQQPGSPAKLLTREDRSFVASVTMPYFAPVTRVDETLFDWSSWNDSTPRGRETKRVRRSSYEYDRHGNVTKESLYEPGGSPSPGHVILRTFVQSSTTSSLYLPTVEEVYGTMDAHVPNRRVELRYDGLALGSVTKGFLSSLTIVSQLAGDNPRSETRFNYGMDGKYKEDQNGRILSIVDPAGNLTTRTFDRETGVFVVGVANAAGHETVCRYLGIEGEPISDGVFGQLKWLLSPNAHGDTNSVDYMTQFAYDTFGRLSATTRPLDHGSAPTQTFTYGQYSVSPGEQLYMVTLRSLASSEMSTDTRRLDGVGREVLTVHSVHSGTKENSWTRTVFDERGRVTSQSPPSAFTDLEARATLFTYDALDRPVKLSEPGGSRRRVRYVDYAGWDTRIREDGRPPTLQARDVFGHVVRRIDQQGNHTTFEYGPSGEPIRADGPQGDHHNGQLRGVFEETRLE